MHSFFTIKKKKGDIHVVDKNVTKQIRIISIYILILNFIASTRIQLLHIIHLIRFNIFITYRIIIGTLHNYASTRGIAYILIYQFTLHYYRIITH
ncbi:hypothetical protein PUN28_020265 [Cardiocondyla obscurior]|uniref:Uncharacterized protein n=1 Tax=Cardiocondyla obscurior TaxID=286306 RepID=A0AAW2E5Z4_9HYME